MLPTGANSVPLSRFLVAFHTNKINVERLNMALEYLYADAHILGFLLTTCPLPIRQRLESARLRYEDGKGNFNDAALKFVRIKRISSCLVHNPVYFYLESRRYRVTEPLQRRIADQRRELKDQRRQLKIKHPNTSDNAAYIPISRRSYSDLVASNIMDKTLESSPKLWIPEGLFSSTKLISARMKSRIAGVKEAKIGRAHV